MRKKKRLKLIARVYGKLFHATESFSALGMDLAYLLGCISKGYKIDWLDTGAPFRRLMRREFVPEHRVWRFIQNHEED